MFNMSSYSEWQRGTNNRNFHILNSLLASPEIKRIVVVDFLPFTFHRAIRNWIENIIGAPQQELIYSDPTTRVRQINEKLIVFSTIDSFFSKKLVIKKLNSILEKLNDGPKQMKRVVISYFPMFIEYFGRLNEDLNVFEAVDNWLAHPSYIKYQEILKRNYQIISQKADLIFTVANSLVDLFRQLGRNKDIYWLPNGVDASHFIGADKVPFDMKKIKHPIIGYLGIIQDRLDFNLLEYVAEKNPDKSLVLVGPIWPQFFRSFRKAPSEIRQLKKYKNVYFLGRKGYDAAPNYIHQFDVAIIPHQVNEFVMSMNPMKLYDYLACGKPVVSTPMPALGKFSHLIYFAQDYAGFQQNIEKALAENDAERERLRIEAARENSWQSKVDEIILKIKEKIK